MTKLALSKIRLEGGTQPRAELNTQMIADYADDMRNGAKFPAVVVFYDGECHWLADGFHRIAAAKEIGLRQIDADIRQGTLQDAQWASFGVNAEHGLRRSNEDKRRAVIAALKHPNGASKSNRDIAKHCGVDESTVRVYRQQLEATAGIPQSDVRIGADGRPINTANIGGTPKFHVGQRVRYQGLIYDITALTSGLKYSLRSALLNGKPETDVPEGEIQPLSVSQQPPVPTPPTNETLQKGDLVVGWRDRVVEVSDSNAHGLVGYTIKGLPVEIESGAKRIDPSALDGLSKDQRAEVQAFLARRSPASETATGEICDHNGVQLAVGDTVAIRGNGTVGVITKIDGGKVFLDNHHQPHSASVGEDLVKVDPVHLNDEETRVFSDFLAWARETPVYGPGTDSDWLNAGYLWDSFNTNKPDEHEKAWMLRTIAQRGYLICHPVYHGLYKLPVADDQSATEELDIDEQLAGQVLPDAAPTADPQPPVTKRDWDEETGTVGAPTSRSGKMRAQLEGAGYEVYHVTAHHDGKFRIEFEGSQKFSVEEAAERAREIGTDLLNRGYAVLEMSYWNGGTPMIVLQNDKVADSDEWYTPEEIIEVVRAFLVEIDLDPASCAEAQKTVQAAIYYDRKQDGLAQIWHGRTWLNPPYSHPLVEQFTDKLIDEITAGHVIEAVTVFNNSTATKWFQRLLRHADMVCFPEARVNFNHPRKGNPGNRTGQAFFYFGLRTLEFIQAFEPLGTVLPCQAVRELLEAAS